MTVIGRVISYRDLSSIEMNVGLNGELDGAIG